MQKGLCLAVSVAASLTSACLVGEPPPPVPDLAPDVCTSSAIGTDSTPDYNAYATPGLHPLGAVTALPWRGQHESYPNGDEAFSGYGSALPATVECSYDKAQQSHLDVTDGCLTAIRTSSGNAVGQIEGGSADDAFRVVALGYASTAPDLDIKWTDIGTAYEFEFGKQTGSFNNPGFKAFARYRTEDNLYVASWRMDGVVQIQRKQCGAYTPLMIIPDFGAPTPDVWHRLEFTAVGTRLDFTIDGKRVISVDDGTFSWGTAGIRIDSMDGAIIDDWKVFEPGGSADPAGSGG